MNGTAEMAAKLASSVNAAAQLKRQLDVVLLPPFTALHVVKKELSADNCFLGAQDCFWLQSGAYTGQVSPEMLRDAGCQFCVVGHSEKRGRFGVTQLPRELLDYFSDNDETINLKAKALLDVQIKPIICVGETEYERHVGETASIVFNQVSSALATLEPQNVAQVSIAYEPVWAIGTGNVCDAEEANRVCENIRKTIADLYTEETASSVRILYGGSVNAENALDLLTQPHVDGALVGGASLRANEFIKIMESA